MIDVCQVMRSTLLGHSYTDVYLKRLDQLTGKEGIVVRPVYPPVSRRYLDRSWTSEYIVNVMCRYFDEERAMNTCWEIENLLDGYPLPSANGSYTWTATEVYTEPQELALDEAGMFVWSVQFSVIIERTLD